ncbi:hypothetical protein [Bacillus sp. CH30_1T]|nr:hypothetical protein [Bacillus sp. CH30_1T]
MKQLIFKVKGGWHHRAIKLLKKQLGHSVEGAVLRDERKIQ